MTICQKLFLNNNVTLLSVLRKFICFVILLYPVLYTYLWISKSPMNWNNNKKANLSSNGNRYENRKLSMPYNGCTHLYKDVVIKSVIYVKGGLWQLASHPDSNKTVYMHAFYLDDRQKNYAAISFLLTTGYLNTSEPIYCLAWYQEKQHPLFFKGNLIKIEISKYVVKKVHYVQYMVSCYINPTTHDFNFVPTNISLSFHSCEKVKSVNTYIPMLYKNNRVNELSATDRLKAITSNTGGILYEMQAIVSKSLNNRIGACLTAQYGDLNDTDAFFFIQWMESLLMFGISEVIMYNSSMTINGSYFHKVLQYYVDRGKLYMYQLPTPIDYAMNEIHPATEAIRFHAVNDCLYRNYHKYWYILHIDRDEIPVPYASNTYQKFLSSYLASSKAKKDHTITMQSAFFYTYFPVANASIPEPLPILRHTYRQPTEKAGNNSAGFVKSFINTKVCSVIWSHRCLRPGKSVVVPEKDILVHHYRSSCRMGARCKQELERRYRDTDFIDKYGDSLQNRTVSVLQNLGISL